jgi:hypothetical protein
MNIKRNKSLVIVVTGERPYPLYIEDIREGLSMGEVAPWYYDTTTDVTKAYTYNPVTGLGELRKHLRILEVQYKRREYSVAQVSISIEVEPVVIAPLIYDCPLCGMDADVRTYDESQVICQCGSIFPG